MTKINTQKQILRKYYKNLRKTINVNNAEEAAREVSINLLPLLRDLPKTHIIAGYAPIYNELNITLVLQQLNQLGYKIALPAFKDDDQMVFRITELNGLNLGKYNIPEPRQTMPIVIPDIILAPLVACDRHGTRLGYGKGYYDQAIAELRAQNQSLKVIGISYEAQLTELLPSSPHDQKLDIIVTECKILLIQGS